MNLSSRFWNKVKIRNESNCWEWQAAVKYNGYGMFNFRNKNTGTHRVAYFLMYNVFDGSMTLDHLCRNRKCVNPHHLELVDRGENVRRGIGGRLNGLRQQTKTHCPIGHPYDVLNTYVYVYNGTERRACKECRRRQLRESRTRRK